MILGRVFEFPEQASVCACARCSSRRDGDSGEVVKEVDFQGLGTIAALYTDSKAGTLQATINLASRESEDDGDCRPTSGFRRLSGRETPNNRFPLWSVITALRTSHLCGQAKKKPTTSDHFSFSPRFLHVSHFNLTLTLSNRFRGAEMPKELSRNQKGVLLK